MTFLGSLPSYVMKELIKIVFFYTLVPLDTFLNKYGDCKSQIEVFIYLVNLLSTRFIKDGNFEQEMHQNDNIFRTKNHIFETEFFRKCVQKWKDINLYLLI